MKKLLLGLGLILAFVNSVAAHVAVKTDYPDRYVVKKGDTLWDISGMFLYHPWKWPEIWQVNPQIENPHLIYPGDILSLTYVDGQPRLSVQRGRGGMVKLSPGMRISPLGDGIPAIPLEAINTFLSRSRVVDGDALDNAPRVLAGAGHRIVSGAGDKVYARGDMDPATKVYGIYRKGQIFVDPTTNEALGLQALEIGSGSVVATDKDIATLMLNRSNEEVRVNDRLLAYEDEEINANFFPKAPDVDIDGLIIAVERGVSYIGSLDVVAINQGSRNGLAVGDVLAISKTGEVVKDHGTNELVKLPSERAGLMIAFKVFEKVAYGLVLEADQPLSLMDEVANP